jgi:putative hydrolase of the HAD superfamily
VALDPARIQYLAFDLDDTLFDTFGQLVVPATREASQAMIEAGLKATLEQCLEARANLHSKNPRDDIYSLLAAHFGVRKGCDLKAVIQAGTTAFFDRTIKEQISLFEDAIDTLTELKTRYGLFLVTLGTPKTQMKKVELLKLSSFMRRVFYVDYAVQKSKTAAFRAILDETGLPPDCHLSIGNRLDGEIRDAKALGMQTCLMQHGEFAHMEPANQLEVPDATITRLAELKLLLAAAKGGSGEGRPARRLDRGRK